MAQKRFVVGHSEGTMHVMQVIVDRLTGVNYLRSLTTYGESMVPLYDQNGKIVVTPQALLQQMPQQMPPQMLPYMPPQMPQQAPPQMPPYMPPQ